MKTLKYFRAMGLWIKVLPKLKNCGLFIFGVLIGFIICILVVHDLFNLQRRNILTNIDNSTNKELLNVVKEFFYYVNNPSKVCQQIKKFGGSLQYHYAYAYEDGNKMLCLQQCFDIKSNNCLVYSFGIDNEWSFDDAIAKFGCTVFSFDPTMGVGQHIRKGNIHFYPIALGGYDSKGKIKGHEVFFKRLSTIVSLLGHDQQSIDYLKIDIEGYELHLFSDIMFNTPQLIHKFKQIAMEIHPGHLTKGKNRIFKDYINIFRFLHNHDFHVFYSDMNHVPSGKYPLTYENQTYVVTGSYELVWAQWPKYC